jgi:hypothetical protein
VRDIGDRGNLRALFAGAGFRRLLAARLTSQFGDGLFQAALAGSVLFNPAQQSSPVRIATGFAVLLVPFSLLGPFVGVFLDRWSRREIISVANLIRGALALVGATVMGVAGPSGPFFACAMLIAAVNRFFLAGLSAALPHVVDEPLLVTGNAASSTLGTVAYSLGLGTTALALHTVLRPDEHGYAVLGATGALGYLLAAAITRLSYSRPALGPDDADRTSGPILAEVASVVRGMVAGVRHLAGRRPVALAMGVQAISRTLYGVLSLSTLLLYSRYFYASYSAAIGGLGEVVVLGSLGAVAAAFITPLFTRHIGGRAWIIAVTVLLGVAIPPLALPFVPALLVVATFVANVTSQSVKIVVDTNVQVHCAENFRGRVFSVEDTLFNLLFVIGLFAAAVTVPPTGHSVAAICTVAGGYLVVAAGYAWLTRRYPRLEAGPVPTVPAAPRVSPVGP